MGNRFSRRRDAPASNAGTVSAEKKTVVEPATPNQAEDSGVTQTQKAVETENLEVMTPEATKDECVGSKEGASPAASDLKNDAESEPTDKETPSLAQAPESLVSATKITEPEVLAQPEALKPDPISVLESVPVSHPETDAELILEPVPTLAESLEQHIDLLNKESLLEPLLSSPPLIDIGVPDVASSPTPISVSLSPDESSDISGGEQYEVTDDSAGSSMLEPQKKPEISEFLEKPMEAEAAESLEMPENDVNEENVCEIQQNLELKGSDFLKDLIGSEVKIPEDTPITGLSTSIELM